MQKRILVADDDPAILDVLRLILEEGDYQVDTVSNERGVLAARESPPDMILLDVRMSGTDGRELCRRLKSDEKMSGVPIVMISASSDAENVTESCGADAFIAKPFDMDEMLELVGRVIAGNGPSIERVLA